VRNERGNALVFALLVLALASMIGATVLERGRGLDAATRHDRTDVQARYAAEGGLAHARHVLARDPAWTGTVLRVGSCDVTVTVHEDRVVAIAMPGAVRVEAARPR
jgi:type II secretory pathway component PulK